MNLRTLINKSTLIALTTTLLVVINVMLIYSRIPHPPNFADIKNSNQQYQTFFNYYLPSIQMMNQSFQIGHYNVWRLYQKHLRHQKLNHHQYNELNKAFHDNINFNPNNENDWKTLLIHDNIIPTSFVLAEASYQSHNGTTALFKKSNNLFNMTCHAAGCGLIPTITNNSFYSVSETRRFKSADISIDRYMEAFNEYPDFSQLRKLRQIAEHSNKSLTGYNLLQCGQRNSKVSIANKTAICNLIKRFHLTNYDRH